jgi:hypothetical protein
MMDAGGDAQEIHNVADEHHWQHVPDDAKDVFHRHPHLVHVYYGERGIAKEGHRFRMKRQIGSAVGAKTKATVIAWLTCTKPDSI